MLTLGSAGMRLAVFVSSLLMAGLVSTASARQISSAEFGVASGLFDLDISCIQPDRSGYIFTGTEHGAFYFDGRVFRNLGPKQGLPDGGVVVEIFHDSAGRLIFILSNGVFVANKPLSVFVSPEDIVFRRVAVLPSSIIRNATTGFAMLRQKIIFSNGNGVVSLDVDTGGWRDVNLTAAGHERIDADDIIHFFDANNSEQTFFISEKNGKLCWFDAGAMTGDDVSSATPVEISGKCAVPHDQDARLVWSSASMAKDGSFWLRAPQKIAHIQRSGSTMDAFDLPAGAVGHKAYHSVLSALPDGNLVVPGNNGFFYGLPGHWEWLDEDSGMPAGSIMAVSPDGYGSLWLGLRGSGLLFIQGLNDWANWNRRDGLPDDEIWSVQPMMGPTWFASSGGLASYSIENGRLLPLTRYEYDAKLAGHCGARRLFAVANDTTLVDVSDRGTRLLHLAGGRSWSATCDSNGTLWIAQAHSLSRIDLTSTSPVPTMVPGIDGAVLAASLSAPGDLWFIEHGALHHYVAGRNDVVLRSWPEPSFEPRTIMAETDRSIWVGGSAGPLYHLRMDGNRVAQLDAIYPPTIVSNTVVALAKDRRGWLWVGTDQGVSVFNGKQWTGVTIEDGLIWNDIVQDAISVAPDGTLWFGTSHGASHLLHPERIFSRPALTLAIISARLGRQALAGAHPYGRDAVEIVFGTLNVADFGSVRFRYRMDGVDQGWVDTAERIARYPALPPGTHIFHVYAYNPVTHQDSRPIEITATMQAPWWQWMWVDLMVAAVLAVLVYGLVRLRIRQLLRREHELELLVAERTRAIKAAQEALVIQATMDGLTQTLNRGAIQDRLDRALRRETSDSDEGLTIGLIDVDHFKRINDLAGHLAGDEVLREFSARLRAHAFSDEYLGRYGGEEFLILLEGSPDYTRSRLARLKTLATERAFQFNNEAMRVTCSIGVAHARAGDTWQSLVSRADASLYAAKQAGRDCIVDGEHDPHSGMVTMRRARRRYRDLTG